MDGSRAEVKSIRWLFEKQTGIKRHDLERKARQAETVAHIDEWLKSPGLQPPE
jgi:hypothetical protein